MRVLSPDTSMWVVGSCAEARLETMGGFGADQWELTGHQRLGQVVDDFQLWLVPGNEV